MDRRKAEDIGASVGASFARQPAGSLSIWLGSTGGWAVGPACAPQRSVAPGEQASRLFSSHGRENACGWVQGTALGGLRRLGGSVLWRITEGARDGG